MQTLPPNKTFKELGIDPKGKKFKIVNVIDIDLDIKEGDIFKVDHDDGTINPYFRKLSGGNRYGLNISRFALMPVTHSWDNLTQADVGAKFKNKNGTECEILLVLSNNCFIIDNPKADHSTGYHVWTINHAKNMGWTFLDGPSEPETVKMTVAEVSAEVSKARGSKVVVEIIE